MGRDGAEEGGPEAGIALDATVSCAIGAGLSLIAFCDSRLAEYRGGDRAGASISAHPFLIRVPAGALVDLPSISEGQRDVRTADCRMGRDGVDGVDGVDGRDRAGSFEMSIAFLWRW